MSRPFMWGDGAECMQGWSGRGNAEAEQKRGLDDLVLSRGVKGIADLRVAGEERACSSLGQWRRKVVVVVGWGGGGGGQQAGQSAGCRNPGARR